MVNGATACGGEAPPRRRLVAIFAVIALALLMTSLDQTIVATALHTLQQGLGTSVAWAAWTITAYSLGLVTMLPLAGRLSDEYGRRRIFLWSIAAFSVASLGCGLADNIYVLIALRVLQAAGGAGFTPSATGIIVDNFGVARDKAIGLFSSIFPIGAMVGPVLGGVVVSYWSWRWIFLINVPIGAALVVLGLRLIPADRARRLRTRGRFDRLGLALLATTLLLLMIGLSKIGEGGAANVAFGSALIGVALVSLVNFLRHVRRYPDPIISPRLIYGDGFGAINVINVVYGGGVSGLMALVPLYATTRYRIDALGSGTVLVGQGVAVIITSVVATMVLRRTGQRGPILVGGLLIVGGLLMLSVHPPWPGPYAWMLIAAAVVGTGLGWLNPASRNAGLQLAPGDAASIAALRTTGRQMGSITAISVTTALVARAADPSTTQALIYVAWPAAMLMMLPVIRRVPEHRGTW